MTDEPTAPLPTTAPAIPIVETHEASALAREILAICAGRDLIVAISAASTVLGEIMSDLPAGLHESIMRQMEVGIRMRRRLFGREERLQ